MGSPHGAQGAGHPGVVLRHQSDAAAVAVLSSIGAHLGTGGDVDGAAFNVDLATTLEHNLPALVLFHAHGNEAALLVHHRTMHVNAPGRDRAGLLHLPIAHGHFEAHERCAGIHQLHLAGGDQASVATGCGNAAAVLHTVAHQHDLPAKRGGDLALVDDRAGSGAVLFKEVFATEEVCIAHAQAGGHQSAHVNAGVFAKYNAVGVEQPDLAVALQAAQDVGGVLAQYTVEHLARHAGLLEDDAVLCADGEGLPVQYGFV